MNKINVECEVIQDLLPLYQDEVCSMASKKLVEEHIEKCKECKKIRNTLMNHVVDEELIREKNDILEIHERKERKKTFVIGTVTAGVLLVPVIVCLLCNIIIGHALDWFFIVLASLMMIASFTVVPLVAEYRRGTKTIICFTLSLLLLLLTCCIYSNGDWFVVAASSCILGLSILFAPYVINNITLPGMLKNKKGLVVMSWDTLCLYTLIVACGLFCKGDTTYWRLGLAITFYGLLLPWGIFLVIRYIRDSILIKTGLVVIIIGVFFAFINDAIGILSGVFVGSSICFVDLSKGFHTKNAEILNANILMLGLLLSLCVGGLLIFIGIIKKEKIKLYTFLSANKKLIILDEFTNALDKQSVLDIYEFINQYIKKFDCSIINITHNLSDLEYIQGDYYYFFEKKIVKISSKKEAIGSYIKGEV